MIDVKDIPLDRRAALAGAVFLIVLAILGFRSQQAAEKVLVSQDTSVAAVVSTGGDPYGLMGLARRDSLLRNAKAKRGNPFHNPNFIQEVVPEPTIAMEPTPEPKKPTGPRLLTLLHDDVNPCVQIDIAGERSGWLHRGDSFRGWSVNEIARGSVTIVKGDENLVLR